MRRLIAAVLLFGISGAARAATNPADIGIPEDILSLRDPFKKPALKNAGKPGATKNDLESYAVDAFKLVGVLTGPEKVKAMIVAPDGKSFFVSERMKIGQKRGFIRKITPEAIFIREKATNLLGQEENVDTEIRLQTSNPLGANKDQPLMSTEIQPAAPPGMPNDPGFPMMPQGGGK